ncbi:MAG: hypothetical protein IJY89_00785 [Clostridia bacterium]|nr:hypothetical protein [Clostridia bacterium]
MTTNRGKQSMRLYKAAAVCALLASLLWPAVFVLQCSFSERVINLSLLEGQSFSEALKTLFDLLNETDMSLAYDMPHLPGMLVLGPLVLAFAIVCLKAKDRRRGKKHSCIAAGLALESYAAVSFMANILLAILIYYKEWSAGASHNVILRILFTAFGSGFAELAMISLFAVSLIITGHTGHSRPLAVSTGAICIFRLFEDSLWLFTGIFDGTLVSATGVQIAHGVLFLVAMSLTFAGAVLVAMSSVDEENTEEEGTA